MRRQARRFGTGMSCPASSTGRRRFSGLHGIDPQTPNGILFDAWANAVHPDDRAHGAADGRSAGSQGTPFSIDYRVPLGNGIRWVRSQAIVLEGADGRPSRVTGINLDVTDQHREEERLRISGRHARNGGRGTHPRTRPHLRIVERSLRGGRLRRLAEDRQPGLVAPARLLAGRSAGATVHFVRRSRRPLRVNRGDEAARSRRGHSRLRGRLVGADGRVHCVSWSAVPEGDVYYVVGRDVTRDKERDEALRQSQKMEAVGQLTGGIAHDFNNLLQAVHGNLDLIRRRAEDERIRKWAAQGVQAAERGAKLTAQLLAFSRAQKLELVPVDAPRLVAGMSELLARTLGPAVRIRMDLAQDGTAVLADPTQLEMAVLNLAINARDAMPDGGDLVIRTRRQPRCARSRGAAGRLPAS